MQIYILANSFLSCNREKPPLHVYPRETSYAFPLLNVLNNVHTLLVDRYDELVIRNRNVFHWCVVAVDSMFATRQVK